MTTAILSAAVVYVLGLMGIFFKSTVSDESGKPVFNRFGVPTLTTAGWVVVLLMTVAFSLAVWSTVAKAQSDAAAKKKADEKQDKLAKQNGDLIKKLEELQKKVLDEKVTSISAVVTYSLDEEVLDDRPANAGPILQETPRLEIAVSPKIENVSTLHGWSSRLTLKNPKYHAISSTQTSSKRDLSNDGGPAFAEDRRFESFELSAPDLGRLADWQEVTMDGVFTAEPVDDWLLVMDKHAAPDSKQLSDSFYKASDRAQFNDSGIVVDAVPIIVELRLLINGRPLRVPGGWRGQLAIMKDSDQIRPRCVVKFPPAVGTLGLNGSQR